MKDISKKLHKKLKKFEEGKMSLDELEELVDDARELYERLVILKYKAYEKYGDPTKNEEEKDDTVKEKSSPKKEKKESDSVKDKEENKKEKVVSDDDAKDDDSSEVEGFDLSGITENDDIEQPAFDFTAVEDDSEESAEVEENQLKESAHTKSEPKEEIIEEAEDDSEVKEVLKDSHVERHEPEDEDSLNQKLKVEDDKLSLRKKLQSTPVNDLKDEISIAKKFEYITFMFGGNNDNYEEAIEVLNNCDNAEEAKNKLNEYSTEYDWDLENKSIIKFVELVERRYL